MLHLIKYSICVRDLLVLIYYLFRVYSASFLREHTKVFMVSNHMYMYVLGTFNASIDIRGKHKPDEDYYGLPLSIARIDKDVYSNSCKILLKRKYHFLHDAQSSNNRIENTLQPLQASKTRSKVHRQQKPILSSFPSISLDRSISTS